MHIVDHLTKCPIVLYKTSMVTTLKQVPTLGAKTVETQGKGALQALHAFAQIRLRCFQHDVIVITHHRISMTFPAISQCGLLHDIDKGLSRTRAFKDIPAVVASVHHMVERPLVLHSELPCHVINLSSS